MAACVSGAQAQVDTRKAPFKDYQNDINEVLPSFVKLSRAHSELMFDRQNNVTDKAAQQLIMRQNGILPDNKFIVGGRFNGTTIAERTNTDGKFPILSRLPPTHTSGNSDIFSMVNDASISGAVTLPWVLLYAQGEYTELAYRGQERTGLAQIFCDHW